MLHASDLVVVVEGKSQGLDIIIRIIWVTIIRDTRTLFAVIIIPLFIHLRISEGPEGGLRDGVVDERRGSHRFANLSANGAIFKNIIQFLSFRLPANKRRISWVNNKP